MGFDERIKVLERLRAAIEELAPRTGDYKLEALYGGWVARLTTDIEKARAWERWAEGKAEKKGGESGVEAERQAGKEGESGALP